MHCFKKPDATLCSQEQFRIHSVLGGGLETRLSTNVTVCKTVLGVGSASPYVACDCVSPISVFGPHSRPLGPALSGSCETCKIESSSQTEGQMGSVLQNARQRCWRWPSSERQTRNRLAGVATATTEILVSRQDDGVKEGFTMGTRQASARLMGTSRYFSISRKTGSKFSPISKGTNGEQRRRSVPRLWAPCPPGRRNVSERTASHVDQGGGNAERLGSRPMRG